MSPTPAGLTGMRFEDRGTVRFGVLGQFEKNPLVLERNGYDDAPVVANRQVTEIGLSWDATRRVGVWGTLPVMAHWGGADSAYTADGAGLGDLGLGLRLAWVHFRGFHLGTKAAAWLPTGTPGRWMGEATPRAHGGFAMSQTVGRSELVADLGVTGRPTVASDIEFALGPTLDGGLMLVHRLPVVDLSAWTGLVGHAGLTSGSRALEGLFGARLALARRLTLDAGVGHGITRGAGATDLRALAGVTYTARPRQRSIPVPVADEAELPPLVVYAALPEADDPPPPAPEPESVAAPYREALSIADRLRFRMGTPELLPESQPVIDAIAQFLTSRTEVLQVVVIGHASAEGSYRYNYELSLARAMSVSEALVRAGIHPDRLSVRALGEVRPIDGTTLPSNRRVEFQVTAVGDAPAYAPAELYPWGEPAEKRP